MLKMVKSGRMVFLHREANRGFWDAHWENQELSHHENAAKAGDLGEMYEPFISFLPRKGKVLEAGCGWGQWVLALRARGYDILGMEYSRSAVNEAKKRNPEVPILGGDVRCLPFGNETISGYISLGVIEHFPSGPSPVLAEAWRVLEANGRALISVPHFNAVRKLKSLLGWYGIQESKVPFYQYGFSRKEMKRLLEKQGFEVQRTYAYGVVKGLRDEFIGIRTVLKFTGGSSLIERFFHRLGFSHLDEGIGHMLLFACRKVQGEKR